MSFRIPELVDVDPKAAAELVKQAQQRRRFDASVAEYRREHERSKREAQRRRSAFDLGMFVGGGGDELTPLDLLSAEGMWLSPTRGVTDSGGISSWVDQCASPVTFAQASGPSRPALNTSPDRATFDGVDDFLSTPTASKHQWGATFYWAGWVRRESSATGDKYLWSQWDASNVEQAIIRHNVSTGFQVVVAISGTSFATINFPVLGLNTWVFVEVVYDGGLAAADRCRVYYDRVQQTPSATSGTMPTTVNSANATAYIGTFQASTTGLPFGYSLAAQYTDKTIPSDDARDALEAFEAPT